METKKDYSFFKSETFNKQIVSRIQEILEELLLTKVDYLNDDQYENFSSRAGSSIFGDYTGSLYISCSIDCNRNITKILLEEDNPGLQQNTFALWEMCNIITGNLASFLSENSIEIDQKKKKTSTAIDIEKEKCSIEKILKYSFQNEIIQIILFID